MKRTYLTALLAAAATLAWHIVPSLCSFTAPDPEALTPEEFTAIVVEEVDALLTAGCDCPDRKAGMAHTPDSYVTYTGAELSYWRRAISLTPGYAGMIELSDRPPYCPGVRLLVPQSSGEFSIYEARCGF